MTWFTEEEISALQSGNNGPARSAPPHRSESLAHRMIAIYQANEYMIEMFKSPDQHKPTEKEIEEVVLLGLGRTISRFSEARVEEDPRAAYKRLFVVIMNRWMAEFFGEDELKP